jgi:thiamine biosynthesis lipoprotein
MTSAVHARTPASTVFTALGTTAQIMSTGDHQAACRAAMVEIDAVDRACSRFRPDSDLSRVNAGAGAWVDVDRLFLRALRVGLDAAAASDGAVDPTVGDAVRVLGYDRDFSSVAPVGPPIIVTSRVPGWRVVDIDARQCRVRVPAAVRLDLGATAKGLAADQAAQSASRAAGGGVLVSLGGDIAVAGEPPDEGWLVGVADSHRTAFDDADAAVVLWAGGLATSSVAVRTWQRGDAVVHHLVDPATGAAADGRWRTVTVAAPSCVEANIGSTGAIVLGDRAEPWLIERGQPARLVARDGLVLRLNGWPEHDR